MWFEDKKHFREASSIYLDDGNDTEALALGVYSCITLTVRELQK